MVSMFEEERQSSMRDFEASEREFRIGTMKVMWRWGLSLRRRLHKATAEAWWLKAGIVIKAMWVLGSMANMKYKNWNFLSLLCYIKFFWSISWLFHHVLIRNVTLDVHNISFFLDWRTILLKIRKINYFLAPSRDYKENNI